MAEEKPSTNPRKEEDDEKENANNNNSNNNKRQKMEEEEEEEGSDEESVSDNGQAALLQQFLTAMFPVRRTAAGNNNEELVEHLKGHGVLSNPKAEEVLLKIPRGIFIPREHEDEAYVDAPLRIAKMGFNVSAPHMYAVCLEHLDIQQGMSFLDIGSGCGHFTALGGYLVGKYGVSHGLEIREDIVKLAESNMKSLSNHGVSLNNVKFFVRNCFLPTVATRQYDRIHVGACCPEARLEDLEKLLAPKGILVTPFGDKLIKVTKDEKGAIKIEKLMSVRYGDLVVPSKAEMDEAERELERQKATTIVIPPSTFPQDFMKLLNNKEFSDVTFIVEGKSIPAHKIILAARSEHFKAMFFSGLKESRDGQVTLPDTNYNLFMDCLKFIYLGDLNVQNADHAIDLLGPANYFKLDRLKAICEEIISRNIEVDNAAYILQVASRNNSLQLKAFTLDFIMTRYAEVEQSKCFDDLDKPLLLEVTKAACGFLQKKK